MKYLGNIKEHCKYGCNRNDCKYRNEKNICAKTENICNSDVINTTIERKKLANKQSNKQSNDKTKSCQYCNDKKICIITGNLCKPQRKKCAKLKRKYRERKAENEDFTTKLQYTNTNNNEPIYYSSCRYSFALNCNKVGSVRYGSPCPYMISNMRETYQPCPYHE